MDKMLTTREVAELLNIHPNTVRRWCKQGRIRAYRITTRGDRRFKLREIVRFLDKLDTYGYDENKVSGG